MRTVKKTSNKHICSHERLRTSRSMSSLSFLLQSIIWPRYLNDLTYLMQKLHNLSCGNDIDTICERRLGWKTIQTVLLSWQLIFKIAACFSSMTRRAWRSSKTLRYLCNSDSYSQFYFLTDWLVFMPAMEEAWFSKLRPGKPLGITGVIILLTVCHFYAHWQWVEFRLKGGNRRIQRI